MKTLYIVVPCFNEEEVLMDTTNKLKVKVNKLINSKKISKLSKVMYVNDGSSDNTWNLIKEINKKEELFTGISLSHNRGHQNALVAGLLTAKEYADIVISMDADLQDDIEVIDEMISKYNAGNETVYGVRKERKTDTYFKRATAESFYKLMNLMGIEIVYNHADFRLTSKKVLESFSNFKEVNLFLRGIFPLVGYKHDYVYYDRLERVAGKSKYPLKKMLSFAWDGITSFSIEPIKMVLNLGIIIFILSLIMIIYSVIRKIIGQTVSGWTFTICSIWFIAGIQMLSIGIVGEYIGKIYSEVKQRPRYIVEEDLIRKRS